MSHDFIVGASPHHDGDMFRLRLRQLEASDILLRKLLAAYQQSKEPSLVHEISRECAFISQTLDTLDEVAYCSTGRRAFVISGVLLRTRQYLKDLVERTEMIVVHGKGL